jgi:exodeoxyribonuclease-3
MKIATWNVNGIRAREAQLCEWMDRDQPDVVCLQELKAEVRADPERCNLDDYTTYWHGLRGYSGVSLHVRRGLLRRAAVFSHPEFDMEIADRPGDARQHGDRSVYVPNGGKDYAAKLAFLERWSSGRAVSTPKGRDVVLCGDINIARADIDVHPRSARTA